MYSFSHECIRDEKGCKQVPNIWHFDPLRPPFDPQMASNRPRNDTKYSKLVTILPWSMRTMIGGGALNIEH